MNKKFEYKVLNISDVEKMAPAQSSQVKKYTWLDAMNELGSDGWEYTGTQPTQASWLLKREIGTEVI